MNYQTPRYEVDNGLLVLTLNRREQMNTFTARASSMPPFYGDWLAEE